MAKFEVKVEGIKELQAALKAMGDDLCDALEEAVFQGASVVVKEAQENSKKGGSFPNLRTGNLYRSLADPGPVIVSKTQTRVEMAVGSSMDYARRLEKGFVGTDSRGRRYHQAPRPFLRPALDNNTEKIETEIKKRFATILERYT